MNFEQEVIFLGTKFGSKNGKDWYLVNFKSNNVYWNCFTNKTVFDELIKSADVNSSILLRFNLLYDYKLKNIMFM